MFFPDPDNYEPFVLRPAVFGVFVVILANLLIDGSAVVLRLAITFGIVFCTAILTLRAYRSLR